MNEQEKIDTYGVLELMGHQQIAGKISTIVIGGSAMIRVDVPETKQKPPFTRMFNPNAIYAINPTTEELALKTAEALKSDPIIPYDVNVQIRKQVNMAVEQEMSRVAQLAPMEQSVKSSTDTWPIEDDDDIKGPSMWDSTQY